MKIGYWGHLKGLGEHIKFVAVYTNTPFEEVGHGEEWFATVKSSIDLKFPNLPYLIDGDFSLTESQAIPYYIALKANR